MLRLCFYSRGLICFWSFYVIGQHMSGRINQTHIHDLPYFGLYSFFIDLGFFCKNVLTFVIRYMIINQQISVKTVYLHFNKILQHVITVRFVIVKTFISDSLFLNPSFPHSSTHLPDLLHPHIWNSTCLRKHLQPAWMNC